MSVVARLLGRGAESTKQRSARGWLLMFGLVLGTAGLTGCSSVDSDPEDLEDLEQVEEELEVSPGLHDGLAPSPWQEEPSSGAAVPTLAPLDALESEEIGGPGEDRSLGPGQGQEPDPHPWFVDPEHEDDDYSNAT